MNSNNNNGNNNNMNINLNLNVQLPLLRLRHPGPLNIPQTAAPIEVIDLTADSDDEGPPTLEPITPPRSPTPERRVTRASNQEANFDVYFAAEDDSEFEDAQRLENGNPPSFGIEEEGDYIDGQQMADFLKVNGLEHPVDLTWDIEFDPNKPFACLICMENVQFGEKIAKMECLHAFHKICLKTWFDQNTTCPVCRQQLSYYY